jgi:hypothetical protein
MEIQGMRSQLAMKEQQAREEEYERNAADLSRLSSESSLARWGNW